MPNLRSLKTAVLISASLIAFGASAQQAKTSNSTLSYDYIQLGYDSGKVALGDGDKNNQNTTGVAFSKSVSETFFAVGNYSSTRVSGTTFTAYNLGLGARLPISSSTDFTVAVAYSALDLTDSNPTGYSAILGVRNALSKEVELGGTYTYTSLDSGDSTISTIALEARYNLTNAFSVGLGYKNYQSDARGDQYGLSFRLNF